MPEPRRDGPYFWVTWLTKLLTGENSCEWAAWFKGNYRGESWRKVPSTFDLTGWLLDHAARVEEVRRLWEDRGYTVFTEEQNSFYLRGRSAMLGGKPDLIAKKGESGTIIDVKSGQPRPSDTVQVMLYLYAIPKVFQQFNGVTFDGKLSYADHEVGVPASAADETFTENLVQLIARLSSLSDPARKVPSSRECGFCNITSEDCPERMASDIINEGITDDF